MSGRVIEVAVERIVGANVCGSCLEASRGGDTDEVLPFRNPREGVGAAGIAAPDGDDRATVAAPQKEHSTRNAWLRRVLDAIAIGVQPRIITDTALVDEA